jgi:cyclase
MTVLKTVLPILLLAKLSTLVNIPIIASGGAGNINILWIALQKEKADAALALVFHFKEIEIKTLKQKIEEQ